MDAVNSGDPKAVAVAVDALNKQIEITGIQSGKTKEQIAQQQEQLAALAAQMGGVISTAASLQSAWATLGAQAVTTASQISTLVAQMSQLNLVGAASTWESIKTTYSSSGAAGVVNNFTKEFTTNLKKNADAWIAQGEAVRDSLDPHRAVAREKQRLNDLQKAGVITTDEYNAAVANLNKTLDGAGGKGGKGGGGGGGGGGTAGKVKALGDAAKKAGQDVKNAVKPMQEFADSLKSMAEGALNDLVDGLFAIADGSKKAGEVFRDMAKKMLQDIAKLIVQMLILKPLMGALGGPIGGLFGGGGGIMGRSAAGVAAMNMKPLSIGSTRTNPAIGSYAGFNISPASMSQMRSAMVSASGTAVAQPAPLNVTINNAVEGASVKTRRGNNGQLEIDFVLDVMADALTRGGNRVDQAMARAYGARRVGY
jgi:hypothetical protein